jgi:hypothetical protein
MFPNFLYSILFLMSQKLVQPNEMVHHKPKKKIILIPLSITEDNCKSAY